RLQVHTCSQSHQINKLNIVPVAKSRLATTGEQRSVEKAHAGDLWRQLATMSPPPRPTTSRTAPGDNWRRAPRTEYS
ncbi:hypothetical protein A2U01_0066859, partial [Trifolium medium]|nr:hypothetical protein [Trifolium medium]